VMSLNQLIESPDIFLSPWKAFRYLWIWRSTRRLSPARPRVG
jgi:hypothetical protein